MLELEPPDGRLPVPPPELAVGRLGQCSEVVRVCPLRAGEVSELGETLERVLANGG